MNLSGEEIYRRYEWRYTKKDFRYCPRCGQELIMQPLHIPEEEQLVCHHCQFILYLDPKLVVTGVVEHNQNVLLLRRAEKPKIGKWGLPGGHVQRGEDPRDALLNEIRQEAGIGAQVNQLIEVFSLEAHGIVQLVYACDAISMNVRANIESFEARFFSGIEIPWAELAFEGTRRALWIAGYMPKFINSSE